MKKLLYTVLLILILSSFALPVMAQEGDNTEVLAALPIPAVLLGLMALNNRVTEAVKLYLAADKLPFTPNEDVRRFLVLLASMIVGIVSAAVTPDALSWLGEGFNVYAGIVVTGLAVSLGGGAVQLVLSILQSLRREPATVSTSNTSTISVSPATDAATAKAVLNALGQSANKNSA